VPSTPRSPHELVDFADPPVAEVALSVQFARPVISLPVLAAVARAVAKEYPSISHQPPLMPMDERFDVAPAPQTFEINVEPQVMLPRTMLVNSSGGRLLQLQGDRFALNWRRMRENDSYPRYDTLRAEFLRQLDVLLAAVKDGAGEQAEIALVEVSYFNPIRVSTKARTSQHADLARVINRIKPRPRDAFLPPPEDAQYAARWRIVPADPEEDRPVGRLYLSASPGVQQADLIPMYLVNLAARVIPGDTESSTSALGALDLAHRWVVLGFEDVTTPAMHDLWQHEAVRG